jgi:hypothetical protein
MERVGRLGEAAGGGNGMEGPKLSIDHTYIKYRN